jgi:hypothetical protein
MQSSGTPARRGCASDAALGSLRRWMLNLRFSNGQVDDGVRNTT